MKIWIVLVFLYVIVTLILYGIFCKTEKACRKEIAIGSIKYSWFFFIILAIIVWKVSPTVVSVENQDGELVHKVSREYFFHESPFNGEMIRLKIGTSCIDNFSYMTLIYYATEYAPITGYSAGEIDYEKIYTIPSEATIRVKGHPSYFFRNPPETIRTKSHSNTVIWTLDSY